MGIEVSTSLFPIENEVKPFILVDETLTPEDLFKVAEFSRDDVKTAENNIKTLKEQKYKSLYRIYPQTKNFIPRAISRYSKSWCVF